MRILKTFLALVGALAILVCGYAYLKLAPILAEFDPAYRETYANFAGKLLTTKDPGEAMMWSVPVEDPNLTPEEVMDSLKSLASSKNFLFVGASPFYKQVEAVTGQPYRFVTFLSFCDARVGMMMADYRDAYTGFMPCRIAVVEDKEGKLWLHAMNLDMMIYGGKRLPDALRKEAIRIRDVMQSIMHGAAKGEF